MINTEAQKLTDWTESDAIGKPIQDVLHLIKGFVPVAGEEPEEDPEDLSMSDFDRNTPILKSKNGVERYISANASSITDETSNTFGTIYVFHDITENKKREEALDGMRQEIKDEADDKLNRYK